MSKLFTKRTRSPLVHPNPLDSDCTAPIGRLSNTITTTTQNSPVKSGVRTAFVLFALLLLASCAPHPKVTFFNGEGYVNVLVAVADDADERSAGLMGKTLAPGEGMLFVFEESIPRTFWMKDMLIPLDIIFLDETFTVNEIKENTPPCDKSPCATYPTNKAAMYVVEVEAGFAKEHNLFPGVKMTTNVI